MNEKIYKSSDNRDELAVAMFKLTERIEDNNRLIMTLIHRIEHLESLLKKEEEGAEVVLSDTDEKIVSEVKEREKVTASEIKKLLGYKGSNAASARLNKLCSMGVLRKKYVGRKVYFFLAR